MLLSWYFLHNLILLVLRLRGRPWALLQFSLAVARKLCLFMQNNLLCINPDVHEIPSHHRIRKEKCKKKSLRHRFMNILYRQPQSMNVFEAIMFVLCFKSLVRQDVYLIDFSD